MASDKQLTKRLHDWGFRKNARRKESRLKINSKIRETGRRKIAQNKSTRSKEETKRPVITKTAEELPVLLWSSSAASITSESQSGGQLDIESADIIPQVFSEWQHEELQRIRGSTLEETLFRLFVAIKINPPENALKLHFQTSDFGSKKLKRQYLSKADVENLADSGRSNEVYSEQIQQGSEWPSGNGHQSSQKVHLHAALKFPNMDLLLPSEIQVPPSPLMELYSFPVSSDIEVTLGARSRFATYQDEVSEYQDKFTKLRQICPETHPAMISVMEKLGSAYYHLGKASQAEHWYRCAVTARQETEGDLSLGLLDAWLGVIDAANAQGRYTEAKSLHQEIHQSILSSVAHDHSIVQKSLQIIALISGNLGYHNDAEEYYRQLIQIRLSIFGPRHGKTIAALQRLANPIRRQERYSESEELLSITVELSKSAPGMSDHRMCRGLSSLAKVMFMQGRYNASETLHRQAAEQSKLSLGEDHPATMQCMYHLGRTLRVQGNLKESEKLLRTTLQKQRSALGECSPSTIDSMSELGETLEMANRYQEASTMFEKALRGFSNIWGPGHDYALVACESLGRCYEIQSRYTDALALYGRTIDEIQGTNAINYDAIAEIHGWINRACELWSSKNH
jgi:tetratricopeptide (TPR) repeat protein